MVAVDQTMRVGASRLASATFGSARDENECRTMRASLCRTSIGVSTVASICRKHSSRVSNGSVRYQWLLSRERLHERTISLLIDGNRVGLIVFLERCKVAVGYAVSAWRRRS